MCNMRQLQEGKCMKSLTKLPHFWETKFLEISRAVSNFPLSNSREKYSLEYVLIRSYVTYFTFSLTFPGFSAKIQISLRFWQFFKFSGFSRFSIFSRFVATLLSVRINAIWMNQSAELNHNEVSRWDENKAIYILNDKSLCKGNDDFNAVTRISKGNIQIGIIILL